MPRTLTAGMLAAIAQQFTDPIFLIAQDMGGGVNHYHSTRESISYGGNTYQAVTGARVERFDDDTVAWSLDNSSRALSIAALGAQLGGLAATIRLYYAGEVTDPFTATIDEWATSGQRVFFTATSAASRQQKYPDQRAEVGVFNHLPAAGSSITVGLQTIILEPETEN